MTELIKTCSEKTTEKKRFELQTEGIKGFLTQHGEGIAAAVSGVLIFAAILSDRFLVHELAVTFYLLAYIIGGFVKAREGILTLLNDRELDVNLLMLLAAIGAASIGYWMEGAILIFIFSLSGALESYAMARSHRDISSLMDLKPETATLYAGGQERTVRIEELKVGDLVVIKPGERIPADGRIKEGISSINQASITGESIPVDKEEGDEVFAGTLNGQGSLLVEVTRSSESTLFAKIIRLVQEAQSEMPPSQLFIEKFERIYAKVVIGMTVLLMFVPHYLFQWSWDDTLYRAMVFLVVASPCALVASIMPAILSAISNGARKGLLFKGGLHLENLSRASVVAFDKTGTLTVGEPEVKDIWPLQDYSREEILRIAAAIESLSEHPIGRAVVAKAKEEGLSWDRPSRVQAVTGKGIEAAFEGHHWKIGKPSFVNEDLIEDEAQVVIQDWEQQGKTVIAIKNENGLAGIFSVQDMIRPEARKTVEKLQKMGLKVAMLTGDRRATADAIAREAGVDFVYAELLPEQKVDVVKELHDKYGHVIMIGDGVNDAPALARATVGIAMGAAGSDAALDTADLVLMNDEIQKIPGAIKLGKRAQAIIKQNMVFSIAVILLLIAANFMQNLTLPLGVVGHEGSTILVILNGLRLLR
ncbi:MAG: cadmium-translocating P-type ATPase [Bacillaceae bacterium]|nr:cadmium-translocating P-type ATPase [Bacillaceae bacterium]